MVRVALRVLASQRLEFGAHHLRVASLDPVEIAIRLAEADPGELRIGLQEGEEERLALVGVLDVDDAGFERVADRLLRRDGGAEDAIDLVRQAVEDLGVDLAGEVADVLPRDILPGNVHGDRGQ